MKSLNNQQSLADAVVAAAKQNREAKSVETDLALVVELAGRGLASPESMSLDDIRTLCRSVIARAVADTRSDDGRPRT